MAVTYATDIGASVINISGGGGLDNPKLSRDAMDYAYDNGVTIIASNSDLDSFHHNYPNTSQHAISVHAIRYDSTSLGSATTFFNYNTCTNYGAQLMLSIPATGCSSEAAGRSGGLAGLLYSAALHGGAAAPSTKRWAMRRLTAEEVRQLLIGTADNFYDPADATDPTKYPTVAPQPNGLAFARRFGYGRPNARTAVDAIFAGRLPPEVDIRSPGWFDTIYQDKTPSVTITTHFGWHGGALPAGTTMDWVIEWAPGVDPDRRQVSSTIGHAEMSTMVGDIAQPWDVSTLAVNNPVPAPTDPQFPAGRSGEQVRRHAARARGRCTRRTRRSTASRASRATPSNLQRSRSGRRASRCSSATRAKARRRSPTSSATASARSCSPTPSGRVHAIKADGSELAGWPVKTETLPFLDPRAIRAITPRAPGVLRARSIPRATRRSAPPPAIGDLDGDGKPEVVVGHLVRHGLGLARRRQRRRRISRELDRDTMPVAKDEDHELQDGFFASPALVDLDGDKKLEIVAAGMDGKLYAWHGDGSKVAASPC